MAATPGEPLLKLSCQLFKQTDILEDSDHSYSISDLAEPGHAYSMKKGDNPAAAFRLAAGGAAKATVYLIPHGDLAWLGALKNEEVTMLGRNKAYPVSTKRLVAGV